MNKQKSIKVEEKIPTKLRRITLELHKTDVYFVKVDVLATGNKSVENTKAIKLAWNMIKHEEPKDLEKFRAGDGFLQKILKRENVVIDPKNIQ